MLQQGYESVVQANSSCAKTCQIKTVWREIASELTFTEFELILVSAAAATTDGDKRSSLNLFAGTHFTRAVARLGVGGVEPADAPVKLSSGDRDLEGLGKRPFSNS
jgi:hypothetical protein